jgi:predicted nucleic acid-binding protein
MEAVLDASAALKWQFEDEEATDVAQVLLTDFVDGRIKLITPSLFPYEIISAVNVAINRGRIGEEAGYRAVDYITSLGIELRSADGLVEPIFRIARRYGLSPYDSAYLALAEREKCVLFTGDKRLCNAVKTHLPWVKWIADYPSSGSP